MNKDTAVVWGIIPAAGQSARMGLNGSSKVLLKPNGNDRPLLFFTIQALLQSNLLRGITVACREEDFETVKSLSSEIHKDIAFEIVLGGKTRADSVKNALLALPKNVTHVAIHDGARPLLSSDDLTSVINKGLETDAAILATPCRHTIKRVDGNKISETVDRSSLWEALTPQVFAKQLLLSAFNSKEAQNATDDASLVEQLGHAVSIVQGSCLNIKITTPEDLVLLEQLLPN